jgi:glyoxylase-like metal-dependent hydrolase (beta-lactamase superfamily II)
MELTVKTLKSYNEHWSSCSEQTEEVNQSWCALVNMKITEGIEMLELAVSFGEKRMVIHPTVIFDSNSYVLVDTGMPGYHKEILDLIRQSGIQINQPHSIILTHQDIDHIGSLPHFMAESTQQLDVYAHRDDKSYIDGEKTFLKLHADTKNVILQSLPEKQRLEYETAFSNSSPANVSHSVTDGERLPFGGGLIVIHTPGHTPGHISLYHEPSKTLIAGDAMIVSNGELLGPNPDNTPDMETALKSLHKFKNFSIETVICYHGGIFKDNINKRIEELTSTVS